MKIHFLAQGNMILNPQKIVKYMKCEASKNFIQTRFQKAHSHVLKQKGLVQATGLPTSSKIQYGLGHLVNSKSFSSSTSTSAKRKFLNVMFDAIPAEIDVTDAHRLANIQIKIKEMYGPRMASIGAADIQLFDVSARPIKRWKDFNALEDGYFNEDELYHVVKTSAGTWACSIHTYHSIIIDHIFPEGANSSSSETSIGT